MKIRSLEQRRVRQTFQTKFLTNMEIKQNVFQTDTQDLKIDSGLRRNEKKYETFMTERRTDGQTDKVRC